MAKYCANCGTEIKEGDTKCLKCGRVFGGNKKETNAMAIAGIVCSFLVPLLGLIFSIVGLNKSKTLNDGKELSIVGIVISSILLVVRLIAIVFFFIFAVTIASNGDKIEGAIDDASKKIPEVIERFDNFNNSESNEIFD